MNDKIKNALGGSGGSVSVSEKPTAEPVSTEKDADVSDSNESKIVTTEEELEAYFIIKNLLKDVVDLHIRTPNPISIFSTRKIPANGFAA